MFWTTPLNHLSSELGGCKDCRYIKSGLSQRLKFDDFENKANEVHNNFYTYDKSSFVQISENITVICPDHGPFEQLGSSHLSGHGCKKCAGFFVSDFDSFLKKVREVHGGKYQYIESSYQNTQSPIKFICPKHGEKSQIVHKHLSSKGCPACTQDKLTKSMTKSFDQFVVEANKIHDNKYQYIEATYQKALVHTEIICPLHGSFWQSPDNHLHGKGCKSCNESQGEKAIRRILVLNEIEFFEQWTDHDCIKIKPLKFDFYLPSFDIIIEFDGQQHFRPTGFFGGKKAFRKLKEYDQFKDSWAKKHQIRLLRIAYFDDIYEKLKLEIGSLFIK